MKTTGKFLTILFMAAFSFGLTGCATAQTMPDMKNSTPEQRAQYQTSMMTTKLNLDSGQVTRVQGINLKYAQKMQVIIKSDDGRMAKFKQAKALQEQKDKELQIVFNADQYKQYQAFEQELKSKLRERMKDKE